MSEKKLPINSWNDDDRPREKMLLKGKNSLSDAELLAILLHSGSREESAVELAQKILFSVDNNLNELSKLDINKLTKFKGVGQAKAVTLLAALELCRRRRGAEVLEKKSINSSKDVFELFQDTLADINYEEFWILLLSRANKVIKKTQISGGGLTATVVDPRVVMKEALQHSATSIILVHNHPSGNTKPSQADIDITKKLVNASAYLDISIFDHIIVGNESYCSFADEGIMPTITKLSSD